MLTSRRQWLATLSTAGAVSTMTAPAQAKASTPTFRYCLNTATIRGQKLTLEQENAVVADRRVAHAVRADRAVAPAAAHVRLPAGMAVADRYADRGLVVLGVPANDFGAQEPGSNAEIKKFCEANFDVTFPLADKQTVVGANAHPLYRWAARQTGALGVPTWNFHKILIGRDGRVVEWVTAAGGMGAKLDRAIEAALDVRS